MIQYRAYVLDEHGHFVSAVSLDCADDEAAKEHARRLPDNHEIEVWRLVARIKPEDSPAG